MKIVMTTVNNEKVCKDIINQLINDKVAVCINVMNTTSTYIWMGKVVTENEYLLIIKTSDSKEKKLIKKLEKIHPYDTPEIITFEPDKVSKKYLKYINESSKRPFKKNL